MVTMSSADKALKTLYLGVVSEQLNTGVNPFLARIEKTSSDVWGKEIKKLVPVGINGGIGAGTETGDLPTASGNQFAEFVLTLKNLYGTINISDKAMRASQSSVGAFVDLLSNEMQGLLNAAKFNFGRMLFGDGTGKLCTSSAHTADTKVYTVDTVKNVVEGMIVDCYKSTDVFIKTGVRIDGVDRANKKITLSEEVAGLSYITLQNSKGLELTGLGAIFGDGSSPVYGLKYNDNEWMRPYTKKTVGAISDSVIQTAIDTVDEKTGSKINYILCSNGVKRAYQSYLTANKSNVDIMNLQGGYKAISYNGIPIVSDKFVADGTMYLLNADDFKLHQLCDWKWLEGDSGKVIRQIPNKACYSATLVKYADLMCDKPGGQVMLTGITEA